VLRQLTAMRNVLPVLVVTVAGVVAIAQPAVSAGPVAGLRAIASLSRAAACQQPSAKFDGVVTHARQGQRDLFVQQDGWGLYVEDPGRTGVETGDRVHVEGTVECGLRPYVRATAVSVLGHGAVAAAIPSTFAELIAGRHDAVLVTVRGWVRSADPNGSGEGEHRGATLRMQTDGGPVDAMVHSTSSNSLDSLLDAEVEVTGIAGARQDGKMQRIGVVLYVGSLSFVRVLHKASSDPWNLPPMPMDAIMSSYWVRNLTRRVRVHGTITYIDPGQSLVLEDGQRSLWVNTESLLPLHVGDEIDAFGFPIVNDGQLALTRAELRPSGRQTPVTPQSLDWHALASGQHFFDLVSIEGVLVMEVRGTAEDQYVMAANGNLFSTIYHHGPTQDPGSMEPVRKLPVGSRIRVTGICMPISINNSGSGTPFNILLRSSSDIAYVKGPSPINIRNMGISVLFLLIALAAVSVRFWRVEHGVRRQMATLAYSERRRSRILEQINGSVPLAEIIEQTTELVSFRLHGAPCWVQVDGGARLGSLPDNLEGVRVRAHEVPSRSGPALANIFTAFDPLARSSRDEKEALAMAAGLIELAIETRKVYTDLLHRSEFDQLTDVQNRFSLERSLDKEIRFARDSAGIFGLVYIDLNEFKQVNDVYGHQVGDLYLQEVAQRMKRQLRPGDLLARLGGDEFAILVPEVHSRAEVEEIAMRLNRCFEEPFAAEDCVVEGSASIGFAMYPEDARSRDDLLSAADAAMYVMKHMRPRHANHPLLRKANSASAD